MWTYESTITYFEISLAMCRDFKAVDKALSSKAGLEILIENATASVEIKEEYSKIVKKQLTRMLLTLNCEKCAEMYQDRIKPFLEDCRKELVG